MKGKDLNDWLRKRNIRQIELAEKLGMSQQTFSAVTRSPDVKSGILERIAAALGCKVSELYGEAPSGNVNASGDNSTAVGGNYSQVNSAKLIDEVAAQRRLTETAMEQNSRLLRIIENMQTRH